MTGDSFAQEWPGQWSRGSRGHRRRGRKDWKFGGGEGGPGAWVFAREQGKGRHGRPSEEELEDLIAMRRMRGGGGPWGGGGGPWGGGGGPWGGGPRGRGRGRARRGDVRLALLRLLAEEPRNGYQLMQTIEERSDGRWRPSPGSVYPTLAQLEDEGLVRSSESEGARHFEITDAGREHVEARETAAPPWEAGGGPGADAFHELRSLIIGIGKAGWQVAQEGNQEH
ncbi:MAG TPA: PadR family transcriptional regulator, partial [Solirubrobacteraceae bacterium]|nr:PadR family transcriptional regulator [Solirubrobacteraceae bacterium]